ncbi:XkdX family protein [Eisenbergiella porci]|nr:XkdX family protein [Eisenbergiella porci]
MSKNYGKVKRYYDRKLWDIGKVTSAVGKWITAVEYEEITGQEYQAD